MTGGKKLLFSILGIVIFSIAWAIVPQLILKDEFKEPPWWYIAVWVAVFVIPFIVSLRVIGKSLRGLGFSSKQFKNGIPAFATITGIDEAVDGMTVTINQQPVARLNLEVEHPDGTKYPVTIKTVLPRLLVPQFQPGVKIPILIDPNDRQNIALSRGRKLRKNIVGNVSSDGLEEERIGEKGKACKAKILALQDTGKSKNFNPVVLLTLEVWGDDIDRYTFEKEVPLPTAVVKKLKTGKTYGARVDPADSTKVMMNIV